MSSSTLQENVDLLIQRRLAEARVRGALSPDIESAALVEEIAISLLLNPRVVLFAAFQARNSLVNLITKELTQIENLEEVIADLANVSYAVTDTSQLQKAKNALLEIESLDSITASGSAYSKFDKSIQQFLIKALKKNVVKKGATELSRSSDEARQDLPTSFATLKEMHEDMLELFYALAVGVPNFLTTPLSTIIGLSTANRVRSDIEDIIALLESDNSSASSRDIATKLISGRAAIKVLGSPPRLGEPVIDSTKKLPIGYEITGVSAAATVSVVSDPPPFTFPVNADLILQDTAGTITQTNFPQTGFDLRNRAHVIGTIPSGVLSFPAGSFLFIRFRTALTTISGGFTYLTDGWYQSSVLNGVDPGPGDLLIGPGLGDFWFKDSDDTYYRQFKVDMSAVTNTAQLISAIQNSIGVLAVVAAEFPNPGSGRLIIVADDTYFDRISVDGVFTEFKYTSVTLSPNPPFLVSNQVFLDKSVHSTLGFTSGQVGFSGTVSTADIVEAFNVLFATKAIATENADGTISITGSLQDPGALLVISGTAASTLGIDGTHTAKSNLFSLTGLVNGVSTPVINPETLVDIGDLVSTPNGNSTVASVSDTQITTADQLPTFNGIITIDSLLQTTWDALDTWIESGLNTWLNTEFRDTLYVLDRSVAVLSGSATPAQRNQALSDLVKLKNALTALKVTITSVGTDLPSSAATEERAIFNSIISRLIERKYDRAADLLSSCRIQELLEVDYETASYAGNLMRNTSTLAKTDVTFPTSTEDEEENITAFIPKDR